MLDQRIIDTLTGLLGQARAQGDPEPMAMTLATADADGRVSARVVLLKGVDERGLRFFTNYHSHKAAQLAANPRAALCLHWKTLGAGGTQVRAEGVVETLPAAESDAYFASRARGSQIGAWASLQSQVLDDQAAFDARIARYEAEFADQPVPRPPHWGGYLLRPDRVEFWHGAEHRLHRRECWSCGAGGTWTSQHLYP
ncbi:MAG TPA: pyridoxamine 5'-phosphate oxidase [Rhodanobacteraceae bacterium]|nr:pyridoxamine 5'-phosphate oxidase [Rhodanobacteraceae bacterium]